MVFCVRGDSGSAYSATQLTVCLLTILCHADEKERTSEGTTGRGSMRVSQVMSMGHDMNMDAVKERVNEQLSRGDSLLTPDVSSSKGVERQGELPVNLPSARPR